MLNNPLPDDLLAAMLRLGFSQYEAQAYCALVQQSPLNGHEVGKLSRVPPSKIYETLQRLEAKGAALVQRSEPVLYAAVPYPEVLDAIRRRFEADLSQVDRSLSAMPAAREPGLVWSLRQRSAIAAAFDAAIHAASRRLFAAIWDEEMPEFRVALEQASARGVEVHVAVYGSARLTGPYCYDLTECGASARERLGGRRLSLVVADDRDAVIAEFGTSTADEAVVTDNSILGLLAIEYVKADVLGRLLINAMGARLYEQVRKDPQATALLEPDTVGTLQSMSQQSDPPKKGKGGRH
ncbi:Transcriptional regulator, TrmB [Thiomonas sp. X19]|uniref:TrmB family transcriptional regulator n=1 Tax=Thiomonas sp. X19 TaxID=1050370 RepID=UPI000B670A9D|nr:helix-turn-helix domain-containing protein [Thiomonas sp. X19]SCC93158.1 Transcriptional regulator, TrmB [Thiomonas sp. X19]